MTAAEFGFCLIKRKVQEKRRRQVGPRGWCYFEVRGSWQMSVVLLLEQKTRTNRRNNIAGFSVSKFKQTAKYTEETGTDIIYATWLNSGNL